MTYLDFLRSKKIEGRFDGFEPSWIPDFLFGFQKELVEWAVRKGKAAIFADCLAGESIINSPDGDVTIEDAFRRGDPLTVYAMTANGVCVALASAPFISGVDRLYRYSFASGRSIIATRGHRFFSSSGWIRGDYLEIGERLAVSAPGLLRSTVGISPLACDRGAGHSTRTTPGCLASCSRGPRRCGEQPRSAANAVLTSIPSQADALAQSRRSWRTDDPASTSEYTRRRPAAGLPSIDRSAVQAVNAVGVEECRLPSFGRTRTGESSRTLRRFSEGTSLALQAYEFCPVVGRQSEGDLSPVCQPSASPLVEWDTLVAVHYIRTDVYFDLEVRGPACYLANGVWSHNCGLGKTPMQLVWAQNVLSETGKPVLVLTPLAVSAQTVREGEKFGIEVRQTRGGKVWKGVNVTNYERLPYFDPKDFGGVVLDESGCIKHFEAKRRKDMTEFFRPIKYRLLCTATAAPNDWIELGTSSEALGQMGRMDMLATFFVNDEDSLHPIWQEPKWRLKPHASEAFWRWVCSWARAVRKPSDLGYEDGEFKLPPLEVKQHVIEPRSPLLSKGFFKCVRPARTLEEQRQERRNTVEDRCGKVASLLNGEPSVAWCHLNAEGDLLERMVPGAVQVTGSDPDEKKEEAFLAFTDGQIKTLVTKPKIGCFGMNWQHCARMTFFPSHSFEQWYQAVRRSWRFGQKRTVRVDVVTTPSESRVLRNLQRKAAAADEMFDNLVKHMNESVELSRAVEFDNAARVPEWL